MIQELQVQNHYNGRPPFGLRGFLNDQCNRIIGYAILRQVRTRRFSLQVVPPMDKLINEATGTRGITVEDDHSYCAYWKSNATYPGSCNMQEFMYRTSSELQTLTQIANLGTYSGGGYAVRLRGNILSTFIRLQKANWIDKRTRLVSLEFSVYNANVNLFASCVIYFEFIEGGGIAAKWRFEPVKLISLPGDVSDQIVAISGVLVMAATIFFTLRELWEIKQKKLSYFSSYWSLLELALITSSYFAVAAYFYKNYLTAKAVEIFNVTFGNAYVRMDYAILVDQIYLYFLAFITFGSTLKLIKILQFNKRMNTLALTIRRCWDELLYFFIAFAVIFFAFSSLFYFLFSHDLREFSRLVGAVLTCISMMLGKFEFQAMKEANELSPILFFVFSVINSMVLINIMLTIIIQGFTEVKLELSKKSNKYDIIDYMWASFKKCLVLQPDPVNQVRPNPSDKRALVTEAEIAADTEDLPDKVSCYSHGIC